ncbi:hypothetical protein OG259_09645 [Streptomyces sp. NBC_00250]|uniref:hypothetical protein n=1 Tax=Streptomyces sp. NBC_00250 TaxID=2903641 RepID=UPI002E29F0A4|nr:hypothetical protein [Streptomyces sp. NBC_00250]
MILLLKLVLAPALVVASTLAGRRWGPSVAGTLVVLPIVAGPILFIAHLEHGREFTADAASASLLGLVSLALFLVVFQASARRFAGSRIAPAWACALLIGWASCLAADAVLAVREIPALLALCGAVSATAWATRISAHGRSPGGGRPRRGAAPASSPALVPPWWDLPARGVVTGLLVLAVTGGAARLGPELTGVLAPFPIATSVVAVFALAQGGSVAAEATVAGVLRGLWGFIAFCFLVAVLVVPLGGAAAFGIAAIASLATQPAARLISALGRRSPAMRA